MTPLLDTSSHVATNARRICYKLDWEPVPAEYDSEGAITATLRMAEANGCSVNVSAGTDNNQCDTSENESQKPIKHVTHESLAALSLVIVANPKSQSPIARSLSQAIEFATGKWPEIASFEELDATGKICLVVSELEQPLLHTISGKYQAFKDIASYHHGSRHIRNARVLLS